MQYSIKGLIIDLNNKGRRQGFIQEKTFGGEMGVAS
jgi:hypothetical protein